MAGTKSGGKKAAAKNLQRDPDFYSKIGAKGGSATFQSHGIVKGFAANPERARLAGAKGGRKSRRGKVVQ